MNERDDTSPARPPHPTPAPGSAGAGTPPPAGTAAALEVDALSTVLDSDAGLVRAVDALSLTIARGETFALVGESGCGKSMTALSLLRLLPDNGRIAGGAVRLAGLDVLAQRERDMQRVRGARAGMIFQEPATSLNPVLPVGRQVIEVIERHGTLRGAAARARALDWFRRVGIPDPEQRIDAYPHQLSGGQKQRVMIALALAAEPALLIADEPTTALDVTIQAQILALLAELQRERGMAMLLITHDLGIVRGMAQRVALMYAGEIVEVAPVQSFFARPRHPYAQLLLRALPGEAGRGAPLAAIPGNVPSLARRFDHCRFSDRCPQVHARCLAAPVPMLEAGPAHLARCVLVDEAAAGAAAQAVGPVGAPIARAVSADAGGVRADAAGAAAGATGATGAASTARSNAHGVDRAAGAAPADAPLLEVRGLRVRFPIRRGVLLRTVGHVDAVRDVSFSLPAGRTLALVGESGSGKTTVAKAVLQLLRGQAIIEGTASLLGRDLFGLSGATLRAARRDVQIVFQDPFASLDPRMTVGRILDEGMATLLPELDRTERARRAGELLDRVSLRRDALARYPHEFSGGQRQRIAIARALAVGPRLLVCDEPTSALDVSVQAQILNLLRTLQQDTGVSYLFITHNLGVVEYLADAVAVMRDGRIVEQGSAADVLGRPADPYTRQLLAAVPRVWPSPVSG